MYLTVDDTWLGVYTHVSVYTYFPVYNQSDVIDFYSKDLRLWRYRCSILKYSDSIVLVFWTTVYFAHIYRLFVKIMFLIIIFIPINNGRVFFAKFL
jgi:hypothetical protein